MAKCEYIQYYNIRVDAANNRFYYRGSEWRNQRYSQGQGHNWPRPRGQDYGLKNSLQETYHKRHSLTQSYCQSGQTVDTDRPRMCLQQSQKHTDNIKQ